MAEGHPPPAAGHAPAEGHVAPTEALLFVLTCILIGISTQFFLLRRIKLPYTALLLVFGLCMGLLQAAGPKTEAFTATLSIWMGIDPHLLLLIFLPTIGFSAGIAQEPHLLRRNWGQILILAWPGVVITFLLIAICGKYFFPYGWSWPEALLFGAMLSATDPVAVVAVLHEVGADEKLANVIDGESLVNDGSALVIFLVLQQFVQGAYLTPGQIVVLFLQLALLGAAMGLAFGLVTSLWLSRLTGEPGMSIVLTFGAAYSCYFVSEELLGASGLLAVVVMGFSMSLIGGRHITNRIQLEMHAFWEALEWMANTILFIWLGIALGFVLLPPASSLLRFEVEFSYHLQPVDAAYAVLLYMWLLVARATSMAVFFPLLCTGRVGYAMTWKTALVMCWAGLRGAVGVAMSLFILLDPLITKDEYKAHCVFFMAIMAFATVLINGSTSKYVLSWLGLLKLTPQQEEVLGHVEEEMEVITTVRLAEVSPDPVLGAPNLDTVKALVGTGRPTASHGKYQRRFSSTMVSSGRRAVSTEEAARAAAEGRNLHRLIAEYRKRFLAMVKASYGAMYQRFELATGQIRCLQEATDKAIDVAIASHAPSNSSSKHGALQDPESGGAGPAGLTDWSFLKVKLDSAGSLVGRIACLARRLFRRQVADQLELVSAFVAAHAAAQQLIHTHITELDTSAAAATDAAAHNRQAVQLVMQESQREVAAAMEYAHKELLPRFPDLASILMSKRVALGVLEEQLAFLHNIEAAGLIRCEEIQHWQHEVDQRLERLQHQWLPRAGLQTSSATAAAGAAAGAAAARPGGSSADADASADNTTVFGEAPMLDYLSSLHHASVPRLGRASVGLARASVGLKRNSTLGRRSAIV